jgi:mono/diheme cytochrome c family protein
MPATDKYVRNMKTMNWVFCLSVVSLAASTLLMLHKDHDDEWREYQKQFFVYETELLMDERAAVMVGSRADFEKKVDGLVAEIEKLQDELDSGGDDYAELADKVAAAALAFDLQGRKVRFIRADLGVAKANRDLGIRDQVSAAEMKVLDAEFNRLAAAVHADEVATEEAETELSARQAELSAITAARDTAEDNLKKYTAEVVRLTASLDQIAPEGGLKAAKRLLMEQPIADGFNSHIRIVQDWLPDLSIALGMTSTARFDRCRTCHLGIDRFGAGDIATFPHGEVDHHAKANHVDADGPKTYPHPFSSHPRPDVYLTGSSPHPLPEFGCTICHDGTGSATSFYNAQHGANDPVQDHEWNEEYGHKYNHFWEYPMAPERLRESTCLKCHHDVIELGVNPEFGATAPKVVEGWELIKKFGCFGCHEINGFDAGKRIGPDLRLEPTEEEREKYANDPKLIAGKMRKVGPSLKHVAGKVSQGWIAYWTEDPKRFRPSTKMPQFFGKELTNLHDEMGKNFSSVEVAAIADYLTKQSTKIELLKPVLAEADRDVKRGKEAFAKRGCLACHSHSGFPTSKESFGPNLSNVHEKLAKDGKGFDWLYTWIRDPQRHHPRTKMPNLFLDPSKDAKGAQFDPAADIATFLLSATSDTIDDEALAKASQYEQEDLAAMAQMYLKAVLTEAQINDYFKSEGKSFPLKAEQIKGDETELLTIETPNKEQWQEMLLTYVGKRSVTRYGCFGCHDINGFGSARPIGTTLQDWGRKDPSRLALEHIEEYLHHHGEPDGSSTAAMVEDAIKTGSVDAFNSEEEREDKLRRAFYYESLIHHGRPGFIFQKLRDPRSYDYEKTSTKRYNERLVMPKFTLTDDEIEAIATFVLGLVAAPPTEKYIYKPKPRDNDRNQGEILLRKYNCISCHMLDMDKMEFAVPKYDPEEGDTIGRLLPTTQLGVGESQETLDRLLAFRPPVAAYTGGFAEAEGKRLPVAQIRGLYMNPAGIPNPNDPAEDQFHSFTAWESYDLNRPETKGEGVLASGSVVNINGLYLKKYSPARTGEFSKWLANHLLDTQSVKSLPNGYQAGPPVLLGEGDKVQTPWLYAFLKEPNKIRHTTVLRMPKFNMSDAEASILANYFAAADGAEYPYQDASVAQEDYLKNAEAEFRSSFNDRTKSSYLDEGWSVLVGKSLVDGEQLTLEDGKPAAPVCSKCHQVGGIKYTSTDPKDFRGPNLDQVSTRLRSDWVLNWINNPARITPSTSMPLNFASDKKNLLPLFHGLPANQVKGVRDALMNYPRILEDLSLRNFKPDPPPPAPTN